MSRLEWKSVTLACLLGACGGETAMLDSQESAATSHGGETTTSTTSVLTFVDQALFEYDPTLDASATAATNAGRIRDYAAQQLGSCASVNLTGTSVTVNLGASTCTLPSGTTVTGSVSLVVSGGPGMISVAITFANVVIDGKAVSGMLTMATADATRFTVAGTLSSGANSLMFSGTRVSGAPGTFTINGDVTAVKDGVTSVIALTNLTYRHGDCYPNGGTARVARGSVTSTVTFSTSTASTGTVSVSTGRLTTQAQLPSYGTCPGTRTQVGSGRDAGALGRDR